MLVRNGLANGAYPYVVACRIFTGADVRAVAGRAGDPASVQGTYGVGFPRTAPEGTAFTSSCTRSPRHEDLRLPSVLDVSIDQFPGTAMIQRLIKNPPKLDGSQIHVPGLADRFGAGAILNRNLLSEAAAVGESQSLTFNYQNKAVTVSITLPPDRKDVNLQDKVIKLGERILRRLRSGSGTGRFVMGPASGRLAGGFRYFSPCKLLTAPGVKTAFSDLAVDTTSIRFTYAEGATRDKGVEEIGGGKSYNELDGSCAYPVTGADGREFTADLSTEQVFDNISLSSLIRSYRRGYITDEKINGVGQAAKIGTFKADNNQDLYDPTLLIGYPYTLAEVQLRGFKGTDAQRMDYLKKIAKQMPARLP